MKIKSNHINIAEALLNIQHTIQRAMQYVNHYSYPCGIAIVIISI